MARNFFARSSPRSLDAGKVDNDAHGCPACPHPAIGPDAFDDEHASTLLPVGGASLDGRPLEFAPALHVARLEDHPGLDDLNADDLAIDLD